jgi:thiol-disulfide isomerase/thioredoxin
VFRGEGNIQPERERGPLQVSLYSKEYCHLCHEVAETLIRIQKEIPLEIKEVDIYSDNDLFRKYRFLIPVLTIEGKITLTAPMNEASIRQALEHAHRES